MARPLWQRTLLVAIPPLFLHLLRLGTAPVHLTHDEVVFALNAHTIATEGRGMDGASWPIYFHIVDNFYSTPLVIYFPALFQLLFEPTPAVIRLPSAIIGAIDVVLVYLVARRLLRSEAAALLAATLLALTPAHLIHARLGVDHLYPPIFVMAALLCALRFEDDPTKPRWLFAAGALLGVGTYSYLGALAGMPVHLAVFVVVLCLAAPQGWRRAALLVGGYALAVAPLLAWLLTHPNQLGQQVGMYNIAQADRGVLQGALQHLSYYRLIEHLRVYHEFFNPSYLFFSGDSSLIDSTRKSGVLLVPAAIFLAVGVNAILNTMRSRTSLLVLLTCLAAPVSALLVGEVKVNRALVLLPIAALICGYGIATMRQWRGAWPRRLIAATMLLATVQFAYFYWDYHGDYRHRTGYWFERNRVGAFERVATEMASDPSLVFYVPSSPRWIFESWQLYLFEKGQERWIDRTRSFAPGVEPIPSTAVSMLAVDQSGAILEGEAGQHDTVSITEIDGTPAFKVLLPRQIR